MSDNTQTEENKTKGEKLMIPCPGECRGKTKHLVIQSLDEEGEQYHDEFEAVISWRDNYQIIQYQGCNRASFRHRSYFSEHEDGNSNGVIEKLYPMRGEGQRVAKDFYHIPRILRKIYRETVDCFNLKAHTLCAAGLRAIVEGVCSLEGVKDGPVPKIKRDGTIEVQRKTNLEGKISGLAKKNILTQKSAEILHQHRYLGNEALHELREPPQDELGLALDILEHVLESVYEIPQKALELESRVHLRRSRA